MGLDTVHVPLSHATAASTHMFSVNPWPHGITDQVITLYHSSPESLNVKVGFSILLSMSPFGDESVGIAHGSTVNPLYWPLG